jgi:eukaryotic-like serine/threonine-protein kinase
MLRNTKIRERAYGSRHRSVGEAEGLVGAVLVQQGKLDEARVHILRGLAIVEEAQGPNHLMVSDFLEELAELALLEHDHATAREPAERSLAIRESGDIVPDALARARFVLARTLAPDPTQRARARTLAEQARDAYAQLGRGKQDNRERVEAWLAQHPLP